jgi:hypothetical protein
MNGDKISFTDELYSSIGGEAYQTATVADFVQPVINIALGVAFLLLLVNLVMNALRVSAQGKKGLEAAKKNITNTLVGLVLVVFAFTITNILASIFVVK